MIPLVAWYAALDPKYAKKVRCPGDDPRCVVSENLLRDFLNEAKANYVSAPEPPVLTETTDQPPINKK